MMFDFTRTLQQAEDFMRRHFKPKAVQAAEKRRTQRKLRDAGRRFTRATLVTGTSGAGILGYGLVVAPLGTAALMVAGAATLIAAGTALAWPKQPVRKISSAELAELVADAEEWLLEQRAKLPTKALPALDAVFFRLNDLHPHIPRLDPNASSAWDLRRLLAQHLPRLVHSYAELPETVRSAEPELLGSLIEGLQTLDEELARLCKEAAREHLVTFKAQEAFLESRYKDGDLTKGR